MATQICTDAPFDVTIAGAGMAGLYTAWRLVSSAAQQSPLLRELAQKNGTGQLRICFLEETDRLGGRLDTYRFNEPGEKLDIELGGMRYNTSHERVVALIAQLEKDGYPLPSRNFPESNNRLFYLRGQQVWESEINAGRPLPYALSEEEKGQTADQLFDWAITNAIGPHKDWTMDQWREETAMRRYTSPSENPVKVYVDAQFQNVGFWNFLYDQLTDDGYRYVTDAGGYDSNTINWNTATAMPYVASGDYAPGARYLDSSAATITYRWRSARP